MAMVKWSDFIPPEYAPAAYGLGSAAAGGGLGWLYDRLVDKKHTARRVGIGALLGALGGLGYGQSVLNGYLVKRDKDIEARGAKDQKNEEMLRMREIAKLLGVDKADISTFTFPSSLHEKIVQELGKGKALPKPLPEEVVNSMSNMANSENEAKLRAINSALSELADKNVIVVPKGVRVR